MQSGAASKPWHQERIRHTAQMTEVIDRVLALMKAANFPERDLFGMRLSLEEAIVNGIVHGNRQDPVKSVEVRYRIEPHEAVVEVEDEGAGFNPRTIPDPLSPENLERPTGRGVFLIRHYMTAIQFNDRGNRIMLRKARSG